MKLYSFQKGFTLLDSMAAITITGLAAATAASFMDEWAHKADEEVLNFSQHIAASTLYTQRYWEQASGTPKQSWQETIEVKGLNVSERNGELIIQSNHSSNCRRINLGDVLNTTGRREC